MVPKRNTSGKVGNKITMPDGSWVLMEEIHGRDLRVIAAISDKATAEDVDACLAILEKRVLDSSMEDPLDMPLSWVLGLIARWTSAEQEAALPPDQGESSQ